MPDDLSKTGKQDDKRINIHQQHEMRYWTLKFGCTGSELEEAVEAVGDLAHNVEAWLKENKGY